jgi:hypothetical protein
MTTGTVILRGGLTAQACPLRVKIHPTASTSFTTTILLPPPSSSSSPIIISCCININININIIIIEKGEPFMSALF